MELEIGDLILVKGTGLISKAIEDIEHSQYSHVAIYVGNNQLIEAEGFEKTGYVSIDKYKGQADVYKHVYLTEFDKRNLLKYLKEQVGTKYDYLLLLWEFLRYVKHIALPYKEYHSHICSTLANDAYQDIKVFLCPGIILPSPADIAESKMLIKIGEV